MLPLPQITLPSGESVMLLHPQLPRNVGGWPPQTQRKAIRVIEKFLQEIYADGSISHMLKLGVLPADLDLNQLPPHAELYARVDMIDKCSWQLAQFMRVSCTPPSPPHKVTKLENRSVLQSHQDFGGRAILDSCSQWLQSITRSQA